MILTYDEFKYSITTLPLRLRPTDHSLGKTYINADVSNTSMKQTPCSPDIDEKSCGVQVLCYEIVIAMMHEINVYGK